MTQSDNELLLKDLCGRLPYGVKCENLSATYGRNIFKVTEISSNRGYISGIIDDRYESTVLGPLELKPYLFPLSSMTEEQSGIYHELIKGMFGTSALINFEVLTDFFNSNHLDYRGLIEKGLAIDATGLNIY